MGDGPYDVPMIAGTQEQEREYYLRRILTRFPERSTDPELLYGNPKLEFLRLINEGLLGDPLPTYNGKAPVGQDEIYINAKHYGVKGDNKTDDTDALNAVAAYVLSLNTNAILFIPQGDYVISGQVTIRCQLEASQATFKYYGTGTALTIGSDSSLGIVTARKDFKCPHVRNMSRGNTGWDGSSVGIKAVNLNTCQLHVPFVQDFEHGLMVLGYGGGFAHTTVHLGALWENHVNLILTSDPSGYSNQNLFLNGRLQQSTTRGAVLDDMTAKQIMLTGQGVPSEGANAGRPNNNVFLNTSFEGHNVAYYKADIDGRYNQFINCRWETQSTAPRVLYRETARWNLIDGGYNITSLQETFLGTLGGGELREVTTAFLKAQGVNDQVIATGTYTPIKWRNPLMRRISYDETTGAFKPRPGRWMIRATVTFAINNTGRRIARINKAGTVADVCEIPPSATNRTTLKLASEETFDGNETFTVEAFQTSGADLALENTAVYVSVYAQYLGV